MTIFDTSLTPSSEGVGEAPGDYPFDGLTEAIGQFMDMSLMEVLLQRDETGSYLRIPVGDLVVAAKRVGYAKSCSIPLRSVGRYPAPAAC
jgi:hypothetical protein